MFVCSKASWLSVVAHGVFEMLKSLKVFPATNYQIVKREKKADSAFSFKEKMSRRQAKCAESGPRQTVFAVFLTHQHGFPHLALFKVGESFFELAGGKAKKTENPREALLRILKEKFLDTSVEIKDRLARFYREDFVYNSICYPYWPAHCDLPLETVDVFLVQLPDKCHLQIPRNHELVAVPFFELYGNEVRYGPIIAAVPVLCSRYLFHFET